MLYFLLISSYYNRNIFPISITRYNNPKVYVVPLPDFTVCPKNLKGCGDASFRNIFTILRLFLWPHKSVADHKDQMSPFLRVIHEEKGIKIYNTPSIGAVIKFKWPAVLLLYFFHMNMYSFYHFYFVNAIYTCSINHTILQLLIGWRFIVTEIGKLKKAEWHSVFSILTVFLPFAMGVASILDCHGDVNLRNQTYNTFTAFISLAMSFEVVSLDYLKFFFICIY